MLIKTFLCIAIILTSGITGMLAAYKYKERCDLLKEIINMFEVIRIEILYKKAPLPVICRNLVSSDNEFRFRFLSMVIENLESNRKEHFSKAWENASKQICSKTSLNNDDYIILSEFCTELGQSGIDGQDKIIDITIEHLKRNYDEAFQELRTKGKVCVSTGFAIGIMISVVII